MMPPAEMYESVSKGSRDTEGGREGKRNFPDGYGPPKPQMERIVDVPLRYRPGNRLAGAGIVPAVVRDV